jgi:5-methyltetrahydropteroyltriglutamate--homocysteine methyltransferase
LLRPQALRQAFRRHASDEIGDAEFVKLQDQCIRDVVALQEEVGLKVTTDGEFRRGSYWGRFVERINGFKIKPASFKFRNDQGHEVEFTAPYARTKIKRKQALALDEYLFLRAVTKVTGKITLPAPSTMHFYRCADFAEPGAYASVETFFADLATIFRQEIGELAAAGCRYIQLDEVAVALLCDPSIRDQVARTGSDPDKLVDLYIDSINQAVSACPSEVTIGVHMCRGNFEATI